MILKTKHNKVLWPALGITLLGATLAGCNNATDNTTATAQDATTALTQEGAVPAELATFFPGAMLVKKAFPLNASAAAHMSEGTDLKFSGKESEWDVYEATQDGQRIGMAILTHSDLQDGSDMHVAFAVDKKFIITQTAISDAPDEVKLNTFIAQIVGKTYGATFQAGKDLEVPAGLSPELAQIAADAVHKGILILEENFNPLHGEKEGHGNHDEHGHDDGHSH